MKLAVPGKDNPAVLIVEDEAIIALDLQYVLKDMGCSVVQIVDTAKDAVTVFTDMRPDIVLMDIILRGQMDGIEAAKQIRRISDVPIIFATANTDMLAKLRTDEIGLSTVISKPVISSTLYTVLQDTLSSVS